MNHPKKNKSKSRKGRELDCTIRKNKGWKSVYKLSRELNISSGGLYNLFNGVWNRKVTSGPPCLWVQIEKRGYNPFQFTKTGIPPEVEVLIKRYTENRRKLLSFKKSS